MLPGVEFLSVARAMPLARPSPTPSSSLWNDRDGMLRRATYGRCRKLIEQGISTEEPGPPGDGEDRVTAIFDDGAATTDSSRAALAATSTASGYNWTWWEDILGIKMTQDRTNISWSFNGSCALTGSTSGEWSWATGTGWQIVSYSGSEYEICSYYRGTTVSVNPEIPDFDRGMAGRHSDLGVVIVTAAVRVALSLQDRFLRVLQWLRRAFLVDIVPGRLGISACQRLCQADRQQDREHSDSGSSSNLLRHHPPFIRFRCATWR